MCPYRYEFQWVVMVPIGPYAPIWVLVGPKISLYVRMVLMGPYRSSCVLMRPMVSNEFFCCPYGFRGSLCILSEFYGFL